MYTVSVKVTWNNVSTVSTDFTVKIYSKHTNMDLTYKPTAATKVTNYDGSVPSSFTCSEYLGMGNCLGGVSECASWEKSTESYTPDCTNNSGCNLCSGYIAPTTPTVTPTVYPTVTPTVAPTPTETSSTNNFDPETYEATSLLDLFGSGCTAA